MAKKKSPKLETIKLDHQNFIRLAELLQNLTGIHKPLSDKNISLFENRLLPLLEKNGLNQFTQYYNNLTSISGGSSKVEFISALTTNTTEFFREKEHFFHLEQFLKDWTLGEKKSHLRIWCTAASTGQEAYTILFTCLKQLRYLNQQNFRFLVTDIDKTVLRRAKAGEYSKSQLVSVPVEFRESYFLKKPNGSYQVLPELVKLLSIYRFNLNQFPYKLSHKFDVIFCRNVLIYFSEAGAEKVVEGLVDSLRVGGLLFVGHVETGVGQLKNLKVVAPGVFMKVDKKNG